MADLEAFIAGELAKPFRWGETDCCSTAARWVARQTGVDPIAVVGWKYAAATTAEAMLSESDLVARMRFAMARAGFRRTAAAHVGDVGLVTVAIAGARRLTAGIRTQTGWVARHEGGFAFVRSALLAWAVANPTDTRPR